MILKRLVFPLFLLASISCNDPPTSAGSTTTTTAPATGGRAILRGAQLNEDARTVDILVNGQVVAASIPYGGVGPYAELDAGLYRIQFFPAGDRASVLIETQVTLSGSQAVTVSLVGIEFQTFVVDDDRSTRADRARLRLANTVPDFPAPFDLWIENGPLVVSNVGELQASAYGEVIPGAYNFVLRRAGSNEEVASISSQLLSTGANYTVYAIGTLRRDDIELVVARDGS